MATILIVDDRASNRHFLTTLLGRGGHRLLEAANGAEALEQVRAQHPDLVITDILMPTMDGYEFVQHLREDPELARTPVIFQTATYSQSQARTLAQSCGVEFVLPKPCGLPEILAAVNGALGVAAAATDSAAVKQAVAEAGELRRIDDTGRQYIKDLQAGKLDFDEVIDHSAKLVAERDLAKGRSKKLSANVDGMQRVMSRLSAVIESGMAMEAERDPATLVRVMFTAACGIVDSKYAAIAVLDDHERGFRHIHAKGIERRIFQAGDNVRAGLLGSLLSRHRAIRVCSPDPQAGVAELPPGHPRVSSVLAMTIASAHRVYGWIHFADKTGAPEFSVEDERLANLMAAKLALLYENLSLYDLIQSHAAKLQMEASEHRRAQASLRASEARFRSLTELSSDWYFEWDADLNIRYTSQGAGLLTGVPAERVIGRKPWDTNATPLNVTWQQIRADLEARKPFREIEYLRVGDDGARHYLVLSGEPIFGDAAEFMGYRGVGKNVTVRKQAEIKVKALNRVHAVLSGINSLIVRVSARDELFEAACRIAVEDGGFRMSLICMVDRSALKIVPVASAGKDAELLAVIKGVLSSSEDAPNTMVARAIREKKAVVANDSQSDPKVLFGKRYAESNVCSMAVLPLIVADQALGVFALYAEEPGFFDAEEMKLLTELAGDIAFAVDHLEKAEKLNYLAFYDPLTGLPNRTLFHDRLSHSLHARGGEVPFVAVVLLDLERFRNVNETLGRQAGDELLRGVGERLLRANDAAARIGADMFALTLRGAHTAEEVNRAVDAIARTCFHAPFALRGEELSIACRVGVAIHPADGADAESLLRNAEAALRRSKRSAERIVFYAPKMNARVAEALAIENKLRRALERQEFVLHYQPKVTLADGRITGVEALIRWQDPDQKDLVPPDRFIPILEQTGMIIEVGLWVIERALADLDLWAAEGLAVPRVAVNVSAIQLQRKDFVDTVIAAVQHNGDAAGRFELEITESLLMRDVDESIRKLSILRGLGMQISMDDFGTGYSSLSYLARLPIDTVKIDRAFVNGMVGNAEDAAIVSGIIALVHSLRLPVIAEGVETPEQAQRLAALGCDEAQGYHFSRPVPAAQIEVLMRAGGTLPTDARA